MSFLRSLPPDGAARDAVILSAIGAGHLDTPTWVRLRMGRVELEVSADYLTIGGERVPMSAAVAQAAVDSLDALLPTPAIVEAIEAQAVIVPMPTWAPPPGQSRAAQTSSALFAAIEEETQRRMAAAAVQPGQLVAGHRKDVVIRDAMRAGRVYIFGARWVGGDRIEDVAHGGHTADYEDYSHGVRATRRRCWLDGVETTVDAILGGPHAPLLGGPVTMLRYPAPAGTGSGDAPKPVPAPAGPRVLRRGMTGDDVRELQRLLVARGYSIARDGIFGPSTEGAVVDFQEERGLEADGVARPATMASLRGAADPPDPDKPARGTGAAALAVALQELAAGAREEPSWSNTGPRIRQYLAGCVRDVDKDGDLDKLGLPAGEWCAAFVGWCDHEAGAPRTWRAAVWEICADARAAGMLRGLDYQPRPGDLAIFGRSGQNPLRGGLGHVARVERFDGATYTTVDGNHGNRVARVERSLPDPALVGWIEYPRSEP